MDMRALMKQAQQMQKQMQETQEQLCLLYTSPSPRD